MNRASLVSLQRRFSEAIRNPEIITSNPDLPILNQPPLGPAERLKIYKNGYWARLTGTLEEDFSFLLDTVGEEAFEEIVRAYLSESPSTYWTLAQVGEKLPEFLENSKWMKKWPYLVDIARFEWAQVLSGLKKEGERQDFSVLASMDIREHHSLILRLNESAQEIETDWNIPKILNGGKATKKESFFVIFHKDGEFEQLELQDFEWALLNEIKRNRSVGLILASLMSLEPKVVSEVFSQWVARGLLVGFKKSAQEVG